jgi:hypothetical protein
MPGGWSHKSKRELNERFGLNLGPEHRVTLNQMMERLDGDPALDAAARVNTRENVRLTFDHKVESVIQERIFCSTSTRAGTAMRPSYRWINARVRSRR